MQKAPEDSELYKALISNRSRSTGGVHSTEIVRKHANIGTCSLPSLRARFSRASNFDRPKSIPSWTNFDPFPKVNHADKLPPAYIGYQMQEDASSTSTPGGRTAIVDSRGNGKIALRACRSSDSFSSSLKLASENCNLTASRLYSSSSLDSLENESPGTFVILRNDDALTVDLANSCNAERVLSCDGVESCLVDSDVPPRPDIFQRSVSEDGRLFPDCLPLDLSMSTKRPSVESCYVQSCVSKSDSNVHSNCVVGVEGDETASETNVPRKMNLLQLADAVRYIIENDPQTSEAFFSSRSSPSSFSDTNSSNSVDEKIIPDDCRFSDPSIEFLTESRESSGDDSKFIKYEMSDSFQAEGIILNSNIIGDKVLCEDGLYCSNKDFAHHHEAVHSTDPRSCVFKRVLQPHATAHYVHILGKNSPACQSNSSNMSKADGVVNNSNGGTVVVSNAGIDSKRRLRLAKADYESMSEEDRRVRHRRLDNERSKQYRERRRRMVSSLKTEIAALEDKNKALKNTLGALERQTKIMQAAVDYAVPGYFLPERMLVSARC